MQNIKKYFMTLALLLTAVTGAWAESKPIGLNVEYAVGDVITTNSTGDVYIYYGEHPTNSKQMGVKITSTQPLTISMIFDDSFGFNGDDAVYYLPDGVATGGSAGAIPCVGESTGDATVVHVASGSGTLADPYVFAPGSAPAATSGTTVDLTRGTGEKINEWTLTNGMPAGNVLLTVAYKDRATMALTYGGTAITTEANAVTVFKGFEQEFAEALTPAVQNIEPTFNSGTAQDVTATLAADFTFKSSDAAIIGFKTGETYAAEGTLDQMEFRALTTSPVTLTVTYKGTDDLESKSQALLVTIEKKTYTVSLADNTEDADSWKGKKGDGNYVNLPITKLDEGDAVTLQYTGRLKVKGVKATSDAAQAATYTLLSAATTSDYGKVVCAAGHLHDAKTAVPDGCTAVGIIGKVTETGHGLILALQNAPEQTWNTINGWTSVTTYAGTTLKVLPDDAARGNNLTSYTTLGSTTVSNWAVAQKSDYVAIFTNLGSTQSEVINGTTYDANVNAYITTGVGGSEISGIYWSATEDNDSQAWFFYSDYWNRNFKTNSYSVRPVIGF